MGRGERALYPRALWTFPQLKVPRHSIKVHPDLAIALTVDCLCHRTWEALALVSRRQGDTARAVRLLERALALAPVRAGAEQPRLRALLESTRLMRQSDTDEKSI